MGGSSPISILRFNSLRYHPSTAFGAWLGTSFGWARPSAGTRHSRAGSSTGAGAGFAAEALAAACEERCCRRPATNNSLCFPRNLPIVFQNSLKRLALLGANMFSVKHCGCGEAEGGVGRGITMARPTNAHHTHHPSLLFGIQVACMPLKADQENIKKIAHSLVDWEKGFQTHIGRIKLFTDAKRGLVN